MINEVYDEIERSGYKGLTYEQISKKFDNSVNKSEKLQAYLSSHYCRKLLKLGLISQECCIDKRNRVWKRKMVAVEYSQTNETNLLKKRPELEPETHDKEKNNNWLKFYESNSCYDPFLSLDQNLLKLFLSDYVGDNQGFFTSEIADKLMMQNRKKFVNRLLQNFLRKNIIVSKPYRDGKNLYKKLYINFELLDKSNKHKIKELFTDDVKSNKQILNDNGYNVDENSETYVPLDRKDNDTTIELLDKEILLDLVQILINNKVPPLFNLLLINNKLDKHFENLKGKMANAYLDSLDTEEYNSLCEKIINLAISHSQDLFGKSSFVDTVKRRSMLCTSLRFVRTVRILNIVRKHGYISVRDVINNIKLSLESDSEYVIDKKTIINICRDLEAIQLLFIKKFEVNYEEQTEDIEVLLNRPDSLVITKIFFVYHKYNITEEELMNDKYVLKPYYNTDSCAKIQHEIENHLTTTISDPKATITKFERIFKIFNLHANILTRNAIKGLILNNLTKIIKETLIHYLNEAKNCYYAIDISEYFKEMNIQNKLANEGKDLSELCSMLKDIIVKEKLINHSHIKRSVIINSIDRLFYYLRTYTKWSFTELNAKTKHSLVYHTSLYFLIDLKVVHVEKIDDNFMIKLKEP